jgi:threonyl-tRNA synthetase
MFVVTLPDGSNRQYDAPQTVLSIAQDIGAGLAKATMAGRVDGILVDASYVIDRHVTLSIVRDNDADALEIVRHSSAHLLAQAVKQLFPEVQVTIGPVIENGFYYDFAFERSFTLEDLNIIEQKMHEIASQDIVVKRFELSRSDAIAFFESRGEKYKAEIIQGIPENEKLSLYQQGDFTDLCRGPHVPVTSKLKAFKLTKIAGAYWKGDVNNRMLQRIYGTAWLDKKSLDAYLYQIAEAEKRDHRKIGKQLDLFHFQEEAPGMVFWHANGWVIYQQIKQYISNCIQQHGYEEVSTPQIVDSHLWKQSGHWDLFKENMFLVSSDEKQYAVKPMNCPCHLQIFKQGLRSYRDLPMRIAEFGCLHRNELSGAMHGLMRVRQLVQDDAHILCTDEQLQSESANFISLLREVYADFGFTELFVKLATRPEKRVGDDALWDKAESDLKQALEKAGLAFEVCPGEGAFYGPKIEFHLKDSIGRTWQCGTLQVDYSMPQRLEATYISEDGSRKHPVMLHRAILGSFERFIGILIEHFAGKFPVWLAPTQIVVMSITDKHADYVHEIASNLRKDNIRVISDLRNEKIGFKIREHTLRQIPYLAIVGDKETDTHTVALRSQQGQDMGVVSYDQLKTIIKDAIAIRSRIQ